MYLSKLEIFGFKSFANKTHLNFTKGITGIVGPNGCGKTNIVDGIRWVLGEQKTSMLRSDKMENVIFNGTRNKKPMGMAEISLTLVNDQGVLPTEYSEVTITRRIFRSGESEYLLNKNICRLKDITNLFMDTGMGTNAYSVIELKMVETILSNKADERRHMFEEAAGVNKYKLRRRLALKKLDEVKSDLVRVNDIVAEVEKNVRSLQRQAKKADKYNQLQSILREIEIDLAEREFALHTDTRGNLEIQKEELNFQKELTDNNIRKIENELIEYRNRIRAVESELNAKLSEINTESEKLHEVQKNISVSEERSRSLKLNIDKYEEEINELKIQQDETVVNIDNNKNSIIEFNHKILEKVKVIEQGELIVLDKRKSVELKREELRGKREKSNDLSKKIHFNENSIDALKKSLDKTNQEIEKLNSLIQRTTTNIAKTVGYLEDLNTEKEQTQKKLNEADSLLASKQREKEEFEIKLIRIKQEEMDEKNVLNGLRNKIELLQSMVANFEGISDAAKVLLENDGWTQKVKSLFADVGSADEKFRFALEAALKPVLNNLLIDNLNDLEKAITYLKEKDLGKAAFFLLNSVDNTQQSIGDKVLNLLIRRKIKKIEKHKNFISWAYNLVQAEDKWKPYFQKVLFRTAVVKDFKTALELSHKHPLFTFVTPNGDIVQSDGIVDAGSLPKLDQTLFGRKQVLEDLKKEYPLIEKNIKKINRQIEELTDKIAGIDLKNISDRGRTLLNEITNIEKQVSQLEFEKHKYSEEIENTQKKIQQLATDATHTDNEINEHHKEIESLQQLEILANEELAKSETELKHLEQEFNDLTSETNQQKLELERLNGQLKNTENEIGRLEQNHMRIQDTISRRHNEIVFSKDELNTISSNIHINKISFDQINTIREKLLSDEKGIKEKLTLIKNEASKLESELNGLRNDRQDISDRIHEYDIKISESRMRLENIVEHISEEYAIELEYKKFEDLDTFDFKQRTAEVHDNKQKLKELGPINLLAYSEYEEENERLEFLLKQRDDLVQSERDLVKTIEEINEAAEKLFLDTFQQIKENFKGIFQTLFDPGDEADLLLQEGVDPLEAKIEIIAKPKGKRPTGIELLSGGEKTLTATALLFAIYLVKPSPFCILDEVDAPLDDANIDRFTKLLKEFSNRTQFIIVTHNKRTMNSAENMYGVTMQEEGVSKIAGVQFNDDFKFN